MNNHPARNTGQHMKAQVDTTSVAEPATQVKGDGLVWFIADYDEPDEGDEAEWLMWLSLENYDEEPAIEDDAEWIRRGC